MTISTSNAGPISIGLDSDLPSGERREYPFDTLKAGPYNKSGWLKKLYGQNNGLDYIYIDNGTEYRVSVEASGNKYTEVPSATSIEVTGEALRHCVLSHNSGSTISANNLTVMVGNNVRNNQDSNTTISEQVAGNVLPNFMR